jgi:hypothetical protein
MKSKNFADIIFDIKKENNFVEEIKNKEEKALIFGNF